MDHLHSCCKRGTQFAMNAKAPPKIFSKLRRAAKWSRILSRQSKAEAANYLLQDAIDDVVERMDFIRLKPRSALVIGDWSGLLADTLTARGTKVETRGIGAIDEELPVRSSKYDLIVHLLGLATVNDLPGALIHSRNALTDDGLLLASFPGAGSLPKLRQVMLAADDDRPAPRIHPMVDDSASSGLLQRAGFNRQVVDSHTLSVRFSSLSRLVSDLRDHGLNSALYNVAPHVCRDGWNRATQAFQQLAEQDGKVTESFEMVTLTGWKH